MMNALKTVVQAICDKVFKLIRKKLNNNAASFFKFKQQYILEMGQKISLGTARLSISKVRY
jgi:hypothetical protein